MVTLQNLGYLHPNKSVLFDNLVLNLNKGDKAALIGNNGIGKSILLQLIAGKLQPSSGQIINAVKPYYVPQVFGQFNEVTVGDALQVTPKLNALTEILGGNVQEEQFTALNDDWTIEDRCKSALSHWALKDLSLTEKMGDLSGGQKVRVFLAGILVHDPELILLDEPSNHLDSVARRTLYKFIENTNSSILVVSHDRTLLDLLNKILTLSKDGIKTYGGNYDFYLEQKDLENDAFNQDLKNKEKALRKAKELERETAERRQKLDARGRKKQEKAGLPTISMNTLKNNAEKSTAKLKGVHTEKIEAMTTDLLETRKSIPDIDKMKFDFTNSNLHNGKILFTAENLNFGFNHRLLLKQALDFQIRSGERIAIKGSNGSGKTSLIKIIIGQLLPTRGTIKRVINNAVYIDQDYSVLDPILSIYAQAEKYASGVLMEHEIKIMLTRFLFSPEDWDKRCQVLSGGEKMRLILCCLVLSKVPPELIILDEPTNNLDIQNIEILTAAINSYSGSLLVVSHDGYFLDQIQIQRFITLD